MATYTFCKRFVSACSDDPQLALNVLFHFVHEGPLRIAVDSGTTVLNDYKTIAENNYFITTWLTLLSYRGKVVWDSIVIEETLDSEAFYLELAALCVNNKRLVCDSKQHYANLPVVEKQVILIDRAEAPGDIQVQSQGQAARMTVNVQTATFGSESPIVQGNKNVTKIKQ